MFAQKTDMTPSIIHSQMKMRTFLEYCSELLFIIIGITYNSLLSNFKTTNQRSTYMLGAACPERSFRSSALRSTTKVNKRRGGLA